MSETATVIDPDVVPGWPRWLSRIASATQGLMIGVGAAVMFAGAAAAVDGRLEVPILPGVLGVLVAWVCVVAIHEAGHFLAARRSGMTPYCVAIVCLYAWASSNGWRIRFARLPAGLGGFVISHFDADRPLKAQALPMLLGGSAANLVTSLLLGAIGAWFWPSPIAAYIAALAVFSACVGLANLLPARNKLLDNDGLMLLRWLRGECDNSPETYLIRLNALSLKGVCAKDFPVDWVDGLRGITPVGSALRGWFQLCARQQVGAWSDVAEIGQEFEADIEGWPPAAASALSVFIQHMRTEVAFSRAMASGQDDGGICRHIDKMLDWHFPALRSRCQALEAALSGDTARMHALLAESERKMQSAFDTGHRRSEDGIRRSILERLGQGRAANHIGAGLRASVEQSRSSSHH